MTVNVPEAILTLGTFGGRVVMTSYPSVDPSAGGGVDAPVGSLYLRDTGEIYTKSGAGPTNWLNIPTPAAVAAMIAAALLPYSTTAQMNAAIALALVPYATTASMNAAIAAALAAYSTTAQMNTAIAAAAPDPGMLVPPWSWLQDNTSATGAAYGSTTSYANYLGCAQRAYTSVSPILGILTTAFSGITWAELAIAKGLKPSPAAARNLTVVGFTDVSGTFNSTGTKTTAIAVAGGQTIAAGDHLWVVFAKLSTGTGQFRSTPVGDGADYGFILNGGNVRPSVILGTPTNFAAGITAVNLLRMYAHTAV